MEKFDSISDVGIFLGYSTTSKAYRVFNKITLVVEESMLVVFDESNTFSKEKIIEEDDVGLHESSNDLKLKDKSSESDQIQPRQKEEEDFLEGLQTHNANTLNLPEDLHFSHAHPKDQILGDPLQGVKTRASLIWLFLSQIKQKSFKEVEKNESWISTI